MSTSAIYTFTAQPTEQWAGLSLPPLPTESAVSILGRFVLRNRLAVKDLKEHFNLRPHTDGLYEKDHTLRSLLRLGNQFGWRAASRLDIAIARRKLPISWFISQFRYCPRCSAGMFHSTWFQFKYCTTCPLHNVPLQTACSQCEHEIGAFIHSSTWIRHPFSCPHCRCPLSGSPHRLANHMELRRQSKAIAQAFAPWTHWLHLSGWSNRWLRKLETSLPASGWLVWTTPDNVLIRLADDFHRGPPGVMQRRSGNSNEETLVIASDLGTGSRTSSLSGQLRGQEILKRRLARANTAYQTVIQKLAVWLKGRGKDRQVWERHHDFATDWIRQRDMRDVTEYDIYLLAFALMRAAYDLNGIFDERPQFRDYLHAYWSHIPLHDENALKVYFFARYSLIVAAIRPRHLDGQCCTVPQMFAEIVPWITSETSDAGWCCIFPEVSELPWNSFVGSKIGRLSLENGRSISTNTEDPSIMLTMTKRTIPT